MRPPVVRVAVTETGEELRQHLLQGDQLQQLLVGWSFIAFHQTLCRVRGQQRERETCLRCSRNLASVATPSSPSSWTEWPQSGQWRASDRSSRSAVFLMKATPGLGEGFAGIGRDRGGVCRAWCPGPGATAGFCWRCSSVTGPLKLLAGVSAGTGGAAEGVARRSVPGVGSLLEVKMR
jgi:hypothetical protein